MQNDVTYLAILFGLFALMLGLVWVCDRVIGSDEEALDSQVGVSTSTGVGDPSEAAA